MPGFPVRSRSESGHLLKCVLGWFARGPGLSLVLCAACGSLPSTEEQVLRTLDRYLTALRAGRFNECWDLCSRGQKNVWESIRDIVVTGESQTGRWPIWEDGQIVGSVISARWPIWEDAQIVGSVISANEARGLSGREMFIRFFQRRPVSGRTLEGESRIVAINGNIADVRYPRRKYRFALVREDGEWRVAAEASGVVSEGTLEDCEGPGGRQFQRFHWVKDLSKRDLRPVPLPRVPGEREIDLDNRGYACRLTLESNGGIWWKGMRHSLDQLRSTLPNIASRNRDMEHPLAPSEVQVGIALHREALWVDVHRLIGVLQAPSIRIRRFNIITRDAERRSWGIHSRSVWFGAREAGPRSVDTRVSVHVLSAPSAAAASALSTALADVPRTRVESGVRVIGSGSLRCEDALRALVVVGSRISSWIVLELLPADDPLSDRDGPILLDGEPVGSSDTAVPSPGEIRLDFGIPWR